MQSSDVQIHISGPIFTSIVNCRQHNDENVYGLLYGNYRTKRNISMTDNTENDITLEHKITVSHYLCTNSQRPSCFYHAHAAQDNAPAGAVCLGIFVVKSDNNLYPSFKDVAALNELSARTGNNTSVSSNSCQKQTSILPSTVTSSTPLLLLMLSVPRYNPEAEADCRWIYNMKHACFAFTPSTGIPHYGASFCTTHLVIPSLAPDLLKEFTGGICLNTGRVGDSGCCRGDREDEVANNSYPGNDVGGYGCNRYDYNNNRAGLLAQQMTALAAAGMTQVVETELMTAGLVDSIKAELSTVLALEAEVAELRRWRREGRTQNADGVFLEIS